MQINYAIGNSDLERGSTTIKHAVTYDATSRIEGLTQALGDPNGVANIRSFAQNFPELKTSDDADGGDLAVIVSRVNRTALAVVVMLETALSVAVGVGMGLLKHSVCLGLAVGLPTLVVLMVVKGILFKVSA